MARGPHRLAALNAQPVPADKVLQLWALPQGATAPTSLGLLPGPDARLTVTPAAIRPEPGMLIEITLEPPGGSPTGRPTGPVPPFSNGLRDFFVRPASGRASGP